MEDDKEEVKRGESSDGFVERIEYVVPSGGRAGGAKVMPGRLKNEGKEENSDTEQIEYSVAPS